MPPIASIIRAGFALMAGVGYSARRHTTYPGHAAGRQSAIAEHCPLFFPSSSAYRSGSARSNAAHCRWVFQLSPVASGGPPI